MIFDEGNDFFYRFLANMAVAFFNISFSISSSAMRFFIFSYSFTDIASVSDTGMVRCLYYGHKKFYNF